MPSIFAYLAFPIAVKIAFGRRLPMDMLLVGIIVAFVPMLDGLFGFLGLQLPSIFGVIRFMHSLGFALIIALVGIGFARRWRVEWWQAYVWLFVCCMSSALLVAITINNQGVPFLWPLSAERWSAAWQFLPAVPAGFVAFFSTYGWMVLRKELLVLWLPLLGAALLILLGRKMR